MQFSKALIAASIITSCNIASAAPFNDCPSEAFLVQDTIARLYGVQLATGHYQQLSNAMGTTGKLNAIAFNFHDNYLYAWSYEYNTPVQINDEYQITPLSVNNLPGTNFYVGDVSLEHNTYYVYKRGSAYGLYAISLDEQSPDYLNTLLIVDGGQLNLRIFDMAFHPDNGLAYSVDSTGNLYTIDPSTGAVTHLGQVGQSGTFGAVYFDVDENLYISRNNDGFIFRIDTNAESPQAQLFAYGPSSSNNDGARCAMAPVIPADASTIDFGDAPISYGTTASDNGARHDTTNGLLYLGNGVDSEADSFYYPLSDDSSDDNDDEDGVDFVTGTVVNNSALVQVTASDSAYLNAWIDFDHDGQFDSDEKIFSATSVNAGTNTLSYSVPAWAQTGNTWSRFRISSTENLEASGGVSDGEVEDHPLEITEPNTSTSYYPNASEWATVAFEDHWPIVGDYDFNDLVVYYRITETVQDGHVIRIKLEGEFAAVGASYHNGFAFRLPGVARTSIDESNLRFLINDSLQSSSPLEEDRNEAIIIIANDAWDYVSPGENCNFYRSEPGCGSNIQMEFSVTIPLTTPVPTSTMPNPPYDPFLFATSGFGHGYLYGEAADRGFEIHLKNQAPTEAFHFSLLGRGDDASDTNQETYFLNNNGMPWAINIGTQWQHPVEHIDIIYAYPLLQSHINSTSNQYQDWYTPLNAANSHLFTN